MTVTRDAVTSSRTLRHRAAALALIVGVGTLISVPARPAAAASLDSWAAPTALTSTSTGATASVSKLAISSDGTKATAAWVSLKNSKFVIQSASASLIGNVPTWGPVSDLSSPGVNSVAPSIALSADGTKAIAMWCRSSGSCQQSSLPQPRSSGTALPGESDRSFSGEAATDWPSCCVQDRASATAVWRRYNGSQYVVQGASASNIGTTQTWGTVSDLSNPALSADRLKIDVSDSGATAIAVWMYPYGDGRPVQSAVAATSGTEASWGTTTNVGPEGTTESVGTTDVRLSADGTTATALWARQDFVGDPGGNRRAQSASASIGGNTPTWGSVTTLSSAGGGGDSAVLALSVDGTKAVAGWVHQSTPRKVQISLADIAGQSAQWGTVSDLTTSTEQLSDLSLDASGDGSKAAAMWTLGSGSTRITQTSTSDISGSTATWGIIQELAAAGWNADSPQIRVATNGSVAAATWVAFDTNTKFIEASFGTTPLPPPTTPPPTTPPVTKQDQNRVKVTSSMRVGRSIAIARKTNAGFRLSVHTTSPKTCKVQKLSSKWKVTGKKPGTCKLTLRAPGNETWNRLLQSAKVKVKK